MVSKHVFLEGQTCLTKGWYLRTSGIQIPLTKVDQFRIDEGIEVGKMARSIYPEGILINEGSNKNNQDKTNYLVNDINVPVIFEATFIHNDYIARADILRRIEDGWHLIEVKSSVGSDKVKDDLIDDLTYTTLILSLCGIETKKMSLLLVSKNYQLGMSNQDFFEEHDCTEEVNIRLPYFTNKLDEIAKVTVFNDRPTPKLIFHCKDCYFYKKHCLGKDVDDPIFDLPRLSQKKFDELAESGISHVRQISSEYSLSTTQRKIWNAVNDKRPLIDKKKLISFLGEIKFPVYYLDFESVSTAIPLYGNTRPYQEIVTQYSIHKSSTLTSTAKHYEFLADHSKDDSNALAEKLISDIDLEGSVIVYHAQAEKKFINNLVQAVPNLATELTSIIDRIVDLEVIIRETYYHPTFHGSYSIKVVLPCLVPEMNYKDLVIGDGQSAMVIFAELARGKYSTQEAEVMRKELLSYCKQDTLAMAKIHDKLFLLANE